MLYVNFIGIFRDIVVDATSLYFFAYLLICNRYNNRELFITCVVFNICLLMLVMTIVRTDFNLAVGFGLFALLSVITVRSTPFTRTEIAYFFGALSLAVINGSGISDFTFVLTCNLVIVTCAWTMSLWSTGKGDNILKVVPSHTLTIVLESIDQDATHNKEKMRAKLEDTLATAISSYCIKKIDHVKDTMELQITYTETQSDANEMKTRHADNSVDARA